MILYTASHKYKAIFHFKQILKGHLTIYHIFNYSFEMKIPAVQQERRLKLFWPRWASKIVIFFAIIQFSPHLALISRSFLPQIALNILI